MWTLLYRLLRHGAHKLLVVGVVAAVTLGGGALYLAAEAERARLDRDAALYRERLEAVRAEIVRWEDEARRQADLARLAAQRAQDTADRIRELRTWIRRMLATVGLAKEEQRQLEDLEAQKAELEAQVERYTRAAVAARDLVTLKRTEEGARMADLLRAESLQTTWEVLRDRAAEYGAEAWRRYGTWLMVTVLAIVLGPTLWALVLYYGWAPLVALAAPVVLDPEPVRNPGSGAGGASASGPDAGTGNADAAAAEPAAAPAESRARPEAVARAGGVSVSVEVGPDEEVFIKERFLQASDEGGAKRTCWVLDWRHPFTSMASGLIELIHLRPTGGRSMQVTFSTADETVTELLEVEVPEGARLVVRPRHVAGVIRRAGGQGGRWRARWRWGSLHAWITLQFRYFEVEGPVRLLLWGVRGIRPERLTAGCARRTNAGATVGFSPTLSYRCERAETFWAYYRGMNPLFDDRFEGQGLFLVQEVSTTDRAAGPRRFWAAVWDSLLKVLGL